MINNSVIYLVLTVIEKGGWLILLPFYTSYIAPKEFGIYALYGIVTSILIIIASVSLPNALGKVYYDIQDGRVDGTITEYLSTITIAVTISSLLFGILLYLLSVFIPFEEQSEYNKLVLPIIILVVVKPVVDVTKGVFQVQQRALYFSVFSLSIFLIQNVICIILIVFYDYTVEAIIYGGLASYTVFYVLSIFYCTTKYGFNFNKRVFSYALKYSAPLLPHNLSGWGMSSIDRVMIQNMTSSYALGIYSLSLQLSSVITVLVGSINLAWSPYMYKNIHDTGTGRRNLATIGAIVTISLLLLSAGIITFGKYVIIYSFDTAYQDVIYYLPWMIFIAFLQAASVFIGAPTIVENPALFSKITIFSVILNIVMNLIFINLWGAIGAVYATFIQKFITTYIYVILGRRSKLRIDYNVIGITLLYLLLLTLWSVFDNYDLNILRDLVLFIFYSFVVLFYATKILNKNDLLDLKK
ncbi:hypothetical protein C9980_20375 [Vibrio mediterranei]|uniref:oligosaccharide flippase family protein n=1 Tax=Vibrio mediterranei TaxID=689 RepID=UPI000D1824D7|nr:oligosaccharide flippase family protein [Vibrio mediterranei]PTC02975.1 hypothetical protein C9980_20375 [Vibrio mediterranei]